MGLYQHMSPVPACVPEHVWSQMGVTKRFLGVTRSCWGGGNQLIYLERKMYIFNTYRHPWLLNSFVENGYVCRSNQVRSRVAKIALCFPASGHTLKVEHT